MPYIPLFKIRDELKRYYDEFGECTSIPFAVKKLCKDHSNIVQEYTDPFDQAVEDMDDAAFQNVFFHSLYNFDNHIEAEANNDPFINQSETIFCHQKQFRCFLHENFAKQTFHQHDYFEITYAYSGTCVLRFEDEEITLMEGNVCIIPPKIKHEPFVLDSTSFIINFSLTRSAFEAALAPTTLRHDTISYYIHRLLYDSGSSNRLLIPASNSEVAKQAARHIAAASRSSRYYAFSTCISWLCVFIATLFDTYETDIVLENRSSNKHQDDKFLLLEFIQNNYRSITLDSTAKHFNYNKAYLSRQIHQITGKKFSDIITELKLNDGADLLQNTDLSLNEIAELVGYHSGDYFSKVFKKHFQVSPEGYRRQMFNGNLVPRKPNQKN